MRRLVQALLALVLALVAAGLIGAGWFFLRRYAVWTRTYPITVSFANARGAQADDAVKMAGVAIGRVERVSVENQQAHLHLRINDGVMIPRASQFVATADLFSLPGGVTVVPPAGGQAGASTAMIRPREANLIGESGDDPAATFARLDTLVDQWTRVGERSVVLLDEAGRATQEARALLNRDETGRELRRTIAGVRAASVNGAQAMVQLSALLRQSGPRSQALLDNVTDLTAEMGTLTRASRPQVAGILADVRKTTGATARIASQGASLLPKTTDPKPLTGAVADLSATLANLKTTTETMNALATSAQQLLGDPEFADNVKNIARNLRATSQKTDAVAANAQTLLGDPGVASDMKETLRNLKQISETSQKLLDLLSKAAAKKP